VEKSVRKNRDNFVEVAQVYKQINAPVGEFGLMTLARSTQALQGDDATYTAIENQLIALNSQRDAIANQMIAMLNAAAFDGQAINERQARNLIRQGEELLNEGDNQEGDN
jgi:hypothetical protein